MRQLVALVFLLAAAAVRADAEELAQNVPATYHAVEAMDRQSFVVRELSGTCPRNSGHCKTGGCCPTGGDCCSNRTSHL
jgi:hypothetical protein